MKNTLHIDTSKANLVSVSLVTAEKELKKENEQKFGSQVLLTLIQELLREGGIELKDLTEISVATGPGSYTGLRVGVAVANALGYSLGIPVNGKKMEVDLEYA
jgi:tRNA threonylcarbamoyladenosine biosynthesis protein TsaB